MNAGIYYIFYYSKLFAELWSVSKLLIGLEAAIGIEPMNKGFAVLKSLLSGVRVSAQSCLFVGISTHFTLPVFARDRPYTD